MKEINEVSFAIELNNAISKIGVGNVFKLSPHKGKTYISDFEDKIITEILPKNLNHDAEDFITNLPVNYAHLDSINKQDGYAMVVARRIYGIKKNIEQFFVYYEDEMPLVDVLSTLDHNAKAIVMLVHARDYNEDNILIESEHKNKAYLLERQTEYDALNNHEEKTLFVLGKEKRVQKENYQFYLLVGNIKLTDKKEYISDKDKLTLYYMQADVQNYLNLWNEYNRIEFENCFNLFKKNQYIRFDGLYLENEIKVTFDDENFSRINAFDGQLCLLGSTDLLNLFKANDLDEYNKIEKDLLANKQITVVSLSKTNSKERSIRIQTTDLDFFNNLNSSMGYICLSLLGNKISYSRREKARTRIITGRAGMQKMHTWFTDNPEPSQKQEHIEIYGNLLTKKNLTPNQREAIDIICNTPDIAIIQGPPGTGKTTVIKEALVQINAQKENKYDFGNNLLSGFRHETVKNLTESIDLFGLPAVKIGDSKNEPSSKGQLEPRIAKFVDNLIEELKNKYADLTVQDDEYIEFKKKYFNYVSFDNSIDSSIEILEGIRNLDLFKYNSEVTKKIDLLVESLRKQTHKRSLEEDQFLNFLYSLPLDAEGLADDKERIEIGILTFEDYFEEECKKLKNAYLSSAFDVKKAKQIRKEAILNHREIPNILISNGKKAEIIEYLEELFNEIRIERTKRFDGDNVAVLDYIDSLTENPFLIRETLLDYTKVLGATNQHSISKNMFSIKDDDVMFDNVFIDEAATSSPLDLFIPMSIAKKKVILVGDHKQLPNIIDEDILDKVEENVVNKSDNSNGENISSTMKKTLFEVLMSKAVELEKKDGIRRVITLDTQFRMNPKLGSLVSDFFYDGKIKSIRPESDFEHDYHGLKGKCLYWLDTPFDEKLDRQDYRKAGSSSRRNIPEAKKIAKHIKEALDSSNYEKLSIGVITIFKDQAESIKKELRNIDVLDENYEMTGKYMDQELLVGTVDAFQGREFDVVYLSLVYVFNEKKNYSRLANENSMSLMNVALSRQKRLLIVVGDMSVYNNELAKYKVKPLYKLAKLCSGGEMHE